MIDYILYLVTSTSTISMVLVQEDDNDTEHVVYYLSKILIGHELGYSHVEKLEFATIIIVQRFLHYILLHKTIVIFYSNPMYHILNH
jgi:hypothetical protein